MRALVAVGTPSHILEATLATAARAAELADSVLLVPAGFRKAREVAELAKEALEAAETAVEVAEMPVKEAVRSAELVLPSAASLRQAVRMAAAAAAEGKPILHVMFPFGPWRGLYYPLVPRWLQWIEAVGEPPQLSLRRKVPCEPFLDHLRAGELRRRVAEAACRVNQIDDGPYIGGPDPRPRLDMKAEGDAAVLTLNGREVERVNLSGLRCRAAAGGEAQQSPQAPTPNGAPAPRPQQAPPNLPNPKAPPSLRDRPLDFLKHILRRLGYYVPEDQQHRGAESGGRRPEGRRCVVEGVDQLEALLGFRLPELEEGDYVLDTSAIYGGVHNVPPTAYLRYHLPYCALVELLHGLAEEGRSITAGLAWRAYQELAAMGAGYIPTHPYKCDVVLLLTDRFTLRDKAILTRDKRAYEAWQDLAKGLEAGRVHGGELPVEVKLLADDGTGHVAYRNADENEKDYAVLQTFAYLAILAHAAQGRS